MRSTGDIIGCPIADPVFLFATLCLPEASSAVAVEKRFIGDKNEVAR